MIAQGKIFKVAKRKRQGTGDHEEFIVDHTLLYAIPEAINGLREKENVLTDAHGPWLSVVPF
jgi:hypothetical protein